MNYSLDDILERLDISAIADRNDKVHECEFFLTLASSESNREHFRWLISAYLNAVYSFFETSALYASVAFTDTKTGAPIEDSEALELLRRYVEVQQPRKNYPYFVKTSGLHPVIAQLYEVRKAVTHHMPLSIMEAGSNLPEGFHLGCMRGDGQPLLAICREALAIIKDVQIGLDR